MRYVLVIVGLLCAIEIYSRMQAETDRTALAASQSSTRAATGPAAVIENSVILINRQIEEFNATRNTGSNKGISAIEKRAATVIYDQLSDSIRCLDTDGAVFLSLTRQADGGFRGTIEVEYHELSGSNSHSWGHITVSFDLPATTGPSSKPTR